MKIDIPAQDLLSIYFMCYVTAHDAPPEMRDEVQAPILKLREQLAKDYLAELTQMEANAQAMMMLTQTTGRPS